MRLVVLGADGFIGSHVCAQAVASGSDVVAVCINRPWRLERVERLQRVDLPGGRWWDEAGAAAISAKLDRAQALILLAYTPSPDRSPAAWDEHEHRVNLAGTARIARLGVERETPVVFASSANVYGAWHDDAVDEQTEPEPLTPYARAKLAAEEVLAQGAGGVSLRLGTVYGPGEDGPRAIPAFARALLRGETPVLHGDGSDVHDYVHVRDVANAFLAASRLRSGGEAAINVGSGIGRSTSEVLAVVAAAVGAPVGAAASTSPRPPSRLVLDCSLARRLLKFEPAEPFQAGVAEEVEWLRRRYGVSPRTGASR